MFTKEEIEFTKENLMKSGYSAKEADIELEGMIKLSKMNQSRYKRGNKVL